MVGLWSPDPPPEPENLEESNPGYLVVVTASDEEYSDEGYEGYEPLSDAEDDVSVNDGNDNDGDDEFNSTDTPLSDSDTRVRVTDLPRCAVNSWELSKNTFPASEGSAEDAACSPGSSTGLQLQENLDGMQAGPSSSRLEMGEQQVAEVMAAMANITLPPSAVPQWASIVPEDQWIQHILARVKHLQNKRVEDE